MDNTNEKNFIIEIYNVKTEKTTKMHYTANTTEDEIVKELLLQYPPECHIYVKEEDNKQIQEIRKARDIQVAFDGNSIPTRLFRYYREKGLSYAEANQAVAEDIKEHQKVTEPFDEEKTRG